MPLDTVARVETPEHVDFHFRISGPARRATAYLIDLLIRGLILFVFAIILGQMGEQPGVESGLFLLLAFLLEWAYYVLFEVAWSGRTPGKKALGLRVVTVTGVPLRVGDSLLRNLLRAADFLPFGYAVGLTVSALDPRFRRLGDLAAGTIVVVEDSGRVATPVLIDPPPTVEELAALPGRPDLTAEDLAAIELFLRRIRTFHPDRVHELAEIVAPELMRRVGVRMKDPVRFLALLHARCRGVKAGAEP